MYEIVFAGFGGQGILASGVILANAGMNEGKFVSWIPAYGAEQRGGTANCTVKIDKEEIGSPFYEDIDILVTMNEPSLDMFKDKVKPEGIIIANSSLISDQKLKNDQRIISVPAADIAQEAGNIRAANIVVLGALIGKAPIVSNDNLIQAIEEFFAKKGDKVTLLNKKAFQKARELV